MAATRGRQYAHQRGLMNSSLGADASHRALLDYAVPLAEADTSAGLSNQQRMAENARHAASIAVERYSVDSANSRHQASLELQRYGIDEETARHAVDAAFREKDLGARVGMHTEELRAARDNLETQIQANREEQERAITAQRPRSGRNACAPTPVNLQSQLQAQERNLQSQLASDRANLQSRIQADQQNLQSQISAAREEQQRAIEAGDRDRAERLGQQATQYEQDLSQRQTEHQAQMGQLDRELTAQQDRFDRSLEETTAGRTEATATQRQAQLDQAVSNAQTQYSAEINSIRLSTTLSEAGRATAQQDARRRLDAQIQLIESTHQIDLDWSYMGAGT